MRIFDKLNVMHCSPQIALIISCETHHQCLWDVAIESWRNLLQKRGRGNTTQVYPNFPIIKERAVYTRDCINQDKKQRSESCQKEFPSHTKLTPGLYLVTCGCKNHVGYGFSMMISGESLSMLFDLVMTRFEANYNPHIIYDASCLAKEYGYNRELRRFMSLAISTDKFHECNHTRCSMHSRVLNTVL